MELDTRPCVCVCVRTICERGGQQCKIQAYLLVLVAIDLVDAVSIDCLVDILVLDVQEYDVGLLDFAV